LGVRRFIVVDNASQDGTTEYLLAQQDCVVFHTEASYSASRFGVDWQNALLSEFGLNRWNILADADELLVYDRYDELPISRLCQWLSAERARGLQAIMIDMYSDKSFAEVHYESGSDFLITCPYYDSQYHFVPRLSVPFLYSAFPSVEPIGGPRLRYCFPQQNTSKLWPRLRVKLFFRLQRQLRRIFPGASLRVEAPAPQSFKIPLVFWTSNDCYITSHRMNKLPLSDLSGALLHFKYFQDFTHRIDDAITRSAHHNDSAEYRRYRELFAYSRDFNFMYPKSQRFAGSESLIQAGLMSTSPAWRNGAQ
jgi:glycosyltransferase involved in cell wall biosynthesis